ncbi:hypothetical protein CUMW_208340 [Citrus unshiu]|nr:hypothetical protein CUMW_208340 [Citrus unshiu]
MSRHALMLSLARISNDYIFKLLKKIITCGYKGQPTQLLKSIAQGLPRFRFETIPDGLPPSDREATQDLPALCSSIRKTCLAPFLELLGKLNSSGNVPQVTCVVSDGIMGFGAKAARILGIPDVQL